MALLAIRTLGDPILRTPSEPVATFDERLARLAADMGETMRAAPGVGLAAPQVGVPRRLFVFDSGEASGVIVNPAIVWRSSESEEAEEGCLSIPGVYFAVGRSASVRVEGLSETGEPGVWHADGFLARIFQHEIDHLDGVLFVDRLEPALRKEAMRAIREQQLGVVADRPGRRAL